MKFSKRSKVWMIVAGCICLLLLCYLMRYMSRDDAGGIEDYYEPLVVKKSVQPNHLELRGILQSTKKVPIAVMTHGRIVEIIHQGSEVKKGDKLVTIDDSEARERIENEEANANLTEMDLVQQRYLYELTKSNEDNNIELFRRRLAHARLEESEELAAPDARRRRQMEIEERLSELNYLDAKDTYERELKMYNKKYITYSALEPYIRSLENAKATWEELKLSHEIERKGATAERRTELRKAVERAESNLNRVDERRKRRLNSIKSAINELSKVLELCRFNMARAQLEVDQATTLAPEDGVFTLIRFRDYRAGGIEREIAPGDERWRNDVIGYIIDPYSMQVNFAFNESERWRIHENQPVTVTFASLPGKKFQGKISRVGSVGKERNQMDPTVTGGGKSEVTVFTGTLEFKSNGVQFRPGMSAQIQVQLPEAGERIYLPREAVYFNGAKHYVLVGSGHEPRTVRGRLYNELYFLVEDGVSVGETLYIHRRRLK